MKWILARSGETGETKKVLPDGDNTVLDKGRTDGEEKSLVLGPSRGDGLKEVPDGGWGWIIVFGCFLIWVCIKAVTMNKISFAIHGLNQAVPTQV